MIRRTRCAFLAKYDDEVNEKGGGVRGHFVMPI